MRWEWQWGAGVKVGVEEDKIALGNHPCRVMKNLKVQPLLAVGSPLWPSPGEGEREREKRTTQVRALDQE